MKNVLLMGLLLAVASTASATEYKIDPHHTNVRFEVDHFGTSTNTGGFNEINGTVQLDVAKKAGSVDIVIPVKTIATTSEAFKGHLLAADLFNEAQHPEIHFTSTQFHFDGDKVTSVDGNLTLLGKTAPVTLTADRFNCYDSPRFKAQVCGGDFSATIDRTQWGMNFAARTEKAKQVKLLIQVEAVKQ
ncbi:YceI family protein [Pelistega europaea]|uniref:Polyisoprenoid-binding protein n=1 Tax=Pelistega europaea TaxID=106147 RepID=A0A7Y4P380_9BURK|nr:YceI family protein [Pelistega europaea]NOL48747.1 polyisoprenoid-binding protein [Pelistega europaea]